MLIMFSQRTSVVLVMTALSFLVLFKLRGFGALDASSRASVVESGLWPPPGSPSTPSAAAGNLSGPHWAVVIETKPPHNLIPLMLHFSSVLGPAWPIVLFTLEDRWDGSVEATGAAFQRAQADGLFHVRFLPPETDLSSSQRVSGFLTSEWLWTQLEAIDRVLLFQTDSIICARAPLRVDDFLEWDYVGAPIGANDGVGYNGGLSLRNPRLFLEVVRRPHAPFENAGGAPKPNWCNYEDQWFFHEIEMRNGRLPSPETAKKFSIESPIAYPYATPIGYHQPQFWNQEDPDGMKKIEQYCPEMSMLLQKRAYLQQERANT